MNQNLNAIPQPDRAVERTAEQLLALRGELGYITVGQERGRIIGSSERRHLELPHSQITVSPQEGHIRIREESVGLTAWKPTHAPMIGGDINGMHVPKVGIPTKYNLVDLIAEVDPETGKPTVRGTRDKSSFFGLRNRTRPLTAQEIQAQATKVLSATSKAK